MDFTNKINTGSQYNATTSPFHKNKKPTKTVRLDIDHYEVLRKFAFIEKQPKQDVLNKIFQYGQHAYARIHHLGKYHK